ncbi:HK97 gp10 family phage protein [Clostridium beijerinckii]|uniref:HK97 gp10 family phage protein n=1 Tax=Clostridium beijerinckii TaxID=1520 RepID=UPI00232E85CC|nr:HK97 gp10 family phage protein [Clostridium beijerinckii]
MSNDGFDFSELTKFEKKLTEKVNDTMPKESRKFIKKEANKLNKKNKTVFKSKGIGQETGNLLKGFKAGKAYKYRGVWSARAFNNSPHAHLLNDGFMWKPHKNVSKGQSHKQTGEEKFIPGFHFMEEAAKAFESGFYSDVEEWLHEVFIKGL